MGTNYVIFLFVLCCKNSRSEKVDVFSSSASVMMSTSTGAMTTPTASLEGIGASTLTIVTDANSVPCFACTRYDHNRYDSTCISLENGCSNCTTTYYYDTRYSQKKLAQGCNKPDKLSSATHTCDNDPNFVQCYTKVCTGDRCNGDVTLAGNALLLTLAISATRYFAR